MAVHERVHIPPVVDSIQRLEPWIEIRRAMSRQLADAILFLPCVKEEQLRAADPNGFFNRRTDSLKMVRGKGNADPRRPIQVHKSFERVDGIQQCLAVVFDGQIRVVFFGKVGQRFQSVEEGFHFGCEILRGARGRAALDCHASSGLPEQFGVLGIAPHVGGKGVEFEPGPVEHVLETVRAESIQCVVKVRAVVIGAPDINGFEAEFGDALAGLLDGQIFEVHGRR